jgi:hypothetical protein
MLLSSTSPGAISPAVISPRINSQQNGEISL